MLPVKFDEKKLCERFMEKTETTYHKDKIISSLRRIKDVTGYDEITEENLKIIDKKMHVIMSKKESFGDVSYNYDRSNCNIFRIVIRKLFKFEFPETMSVYRSANNIPPRVLEQCTDDEKLKELIRKYVEFVKKDVKSKQTWSQYVAYLTYTLIPLKDKFKNNTITRYDIINQIQILENKASCDLKSKDQTVEINNLSNSAQKAIYTFNTIIRSQIVSSLKDMMVIKKSDIKPKEKNIDRIERDYFTDDELEKIADSYKDDRERLIITTLLSTGLRIGGLLNLKVKNLFDKDMKILSEGSTLEKGSKIRKFQIFPAFKQALEKYRDGDFGSVLSDPEYAIFPKYNRATGSYIGNKMHCKDTTIRRIIREICNRAGVNGDHVHTHAFRKTVVVKLMAEGNTLDNVSKFIGHSSSKVTATHYWTPTQSDLIKNMNMSWLISGGDTENSSIYMSSYNTSQLQKITNIIMEGMKAKERLTHALAVMNEKQIHQMEQKWTNISDENVAQNTRNAIAELIDASSTISDIVSNMNTINDD